MLDFLPPFITIAARDYIFYTLDQTALTIEEIDLCEAEEMTMGSERKV